VGVSPVAGAVSPVQREKPNGNNSFLEKFYSGCLLDWVEYLIRLELANGNTLFSNFH
jgi:hypothetical protein